jgi:hypothetical protein
MADAAHERDPREPAGVRSGAVVAVVAGTLTIAAVAIAILWAIYRSTIFPAPTEAAAMSFPAPGLDPATAAHRRAQAARRNTALDNYGWVDRDSGIVRVPVTEAMKLLAGRGQAAFDPVAGLGGGGPPPRAP